MGFPMGEEKSPQQGGVYQRAIRRSSRSVYVQAHDSSLRERGRERTLPVARNMALQTSGAMGGKPDLRFINASVRSNWDDIVLEDALEKLGVGGRGDMITGEQSQRILGFVLFRANADRRRELEEVGET